MFLDRVLGRAQFIFFLRQQADRQEKPPAANVPLEACIKSIMRQQVAEQKLPIRAKGGHLDKESFNCSRGGLLVSCLERQLLF